jgi:very-short-patch-repair endonuclease
MRRNPTEPERRMWMQLRERRFEHFKFRRQFVIEPWIVDFFCPAKGLVIEIDGHTHDAERDQVRDAIIEGRTGFRVVRFTNPDVMQNMDGVLIALQLALEARPDRWEKRRHHPPAPSSEEEGEQVALTSKAPSSEEEGEQVALTSKAPSSSEEGVGDGGGLRNV